MNFLMAALFLMALSATLFLSFFLFIVGVVIGANLTGNYEGLTTKTIASIMAVLPWILLVIFYVWILS